MAAKTHQNTAARASSGIPTQTMIVPIAVDSMETKKLK